MPAVNFPLMLDARPVTANWCMLPSWLPVEGMSVLPVNSFLLKGSEPVLVDTGLGMLGDAFMDALEAEIDPADLRWIWLSHVDVDHTGNLARVRERAPGASIVTNFLGAAKLGLMGHDVGCAVILQPGAVFEAGGHRFTPVRPPYYDAPETLGFFDERDRVFFAVDCFGAMLPGMVDSIDDLDQDVLRHGMVGWSAVDAPWLGQSDAAALGQTLWNLERLDPAAVMSSHLPLARGPVSALTRPVIEAYGHMRRPAADPLALDQLLEMAS